MDDPFLPAAPAEAEACIPMTPSLLFQKLSELKMERELLTRHGEEMGLSSIVNESMAPLAAPTDMGMSDQAGLAILDPLYVGSDDGDRTLVGEDLAVVLPTADDKQTTTTRLGDLIPNEDDEHHDESMLEIVPRSMPPPPDAPIADHVRWHVVNVVHRAMDTLTLDLPHALEETRLGGAALHLVRRPVSAANESAVVQAVRTRLEAVIQGQLIRHVQHQYTRARYLVVSTVERDVRDVCDQSDLLRDDVQVIGAHLDSLQARLEALVTQKINMITETMTRYVNEVVPNEIDRLLRRFMLADGALMRPIYDRIHDHLIPFVAAIVAALTKALRQHADWVNTTVVRRISDDFKGIRQQFAT